MRELVTLVIEKLRRQAAYVSQLRGQQQQEAPVIIRWTRRNEAVQRLGFPLCGRWKVDFSGEGPVVTEENLLRQRGNGRKTTWLLPTALQSPTSASHCLSTVRSQLTRSLRNIACVGSGFLSYSSEQERERKKRFEDKQNQN